jgi:hypothetical protein
MSNLQNWILEAAWRLDRSIFVRRQRWRSALILVLICGLTAGVITRFTNDANIGGGVTVAAAHQDSQSTRQRLDRDAFVWTVPSKAYPTFDAPEHYPRIAPAGPPVAKQPVRQELYNRPPPLSSPA